MITVFPATCRADRCRRIGAGLDAPPWDTRSPTQQLLDFLRPRQLLLVLDNLEHLLNEGVTELILAMLRGAPAVKILATSRQRLNLREEQLYTLAGLHYPATTTAEQSDRVED